MINKIFHNLLHYSFGQSYQAFESATHSTKKAQINTLRRITQTPSWIHGAIDEPKQLRNQFPVSTYEDWRDIISQQIQQPNIPHLCSNISRFEPTSGSSQQIKWIPYTSSFLDELERAYGPWLYDLYHRYPEIKRGYHYWSLSWLPTHLRDLSRSEAELFPMWKRQFLKKTMAIDAKLCTLPSSEEAVLATILTLLSKDISLISVWSPTFLLSLLETIVKEKDEIATCLHKKTFQDQLHIYTSSQRRLKNIDNLNNTTKLDTEFTRRLWPSLKLISAWDTSTASPWANTIKNLFNNVAFQGKGLWATEGVVTIAFKEKYPLSICSHFYEFKNLEDENIYYSWELEKGMMVSPIITSGTGLPRYLINDRLLVTDFYHNTPCFEFQGRERTVDICGEKLSFESIEHICAKISTPIVSVIADSSAKQYGLLIDSQNKSKEDLAQDFENLLCQHYHYKLARELGQLQKAHVIWKDDALTHYYNLAAPKIEISGNIKVESVLIL